ncbi:hypothetical protein [Natronoglomus mannanivorans]|uniref:Uncharacterized protein n=1 Tax=Natronoglomus mannanivorans TaxID=2979990 RepID=A0AAP2Z575_9EURY|nr:hypothetical protein [Halobacteria archaeon AArc-xg1-1]
MQFSEAGMAIVKQDMLDLDANDDLWRSVRNAHQTVACGELGADAGQPLWHLVTRSVENDTGHVTPTFTVQEAIDHMESCGGHIPYELRSGSEYVDDAPGSVPSMTTPDEWYELSEEPDQKYQARCSCGAKYRFWEQTQRCTGQAAISSKSANDH